MRNIDRKPRWVLTLFAHYLAACTTQDTNYSRFGLEAHAGDNAFVSCTQVGPLSCEVPPVEDLATEACARLRDCLEGRQADHQLLERVVACDAPILSAASELGSAAAVATQLDVDGPPAHGAYLFVPFEEGWCPADVLLEPAWNHGGYCETQFELRWELENAGSGAALHVVSERICHMPLDQEEIAAGESDIAMSECRHVRYRVAGNVLTRLSDFESEGPCRAR